MIIFSNNSRLAKLESEQKYEISKLQKELKSKEDFIEKLNLEIKQSNEKEHTYIKPKVSTQGTRNGFNRVLEVPNINTSFKTYMDYRTITDKSSRQWKLQQSAITDSQGFRKVGEYFLCALGSYYSTNIGDKFKITLDSGNIILVILGDCKADIHTDKTNRYIPKNKNVVEFIVDSNKLDKSVKAMGSVGVLDGFKGRIVKIERIN